MKIFCVPLILAIVSALERPFRRFSLVTRDEPAVSTTGVKDRSVAGMCSAAQDALGRVASASASGISTLGHCAQFAKDKSALAVYVSFNKDTDECMWFSGCQCLASSSTCLGGEQWRSVAITDLIAPGSKAVVQTTASPVGDSAVVAGSATHAAAAETAAEPDCDHSDSNGLMQTFQTKCEMNQTMWLTRLIAGGVMSFVILFIAGSFGLAYYYDTVEMASLAAAATK